MDNDEIEEEFVLEFVDAKKAIETNLSNNHNGASVRDAHCFERQVKLINILIDEGIIKK